MGYLTAHTTIRLQKQGVMPFPRGTYSATVTDYCWNDDRRDIVMYNGIYYAVKKPGTVPKGSTPSASSSYWTVTSQLEIIITSMMLAGAIRTDALNVNDNLLINPDGSVQSKSGYALLELTKSFLRIFENVNFGEKVRLSVDEDTGLPELFFSGKRKASYRSDGVSFELSGNKGNLVLDPEQIGAGTIYVREDGSLALKSDVYKRITITIAASPSAGGTVQPSGTITMLYGTTYPVKATPASGYKFDRWSDGGSQSHDIAITKDMVLTAYFVKEGGGTVVNYTVSLSASPTGSGTVSGGGTYGENTVRTVSATPMSGYRFVRWSDGGAQSHSVTWDSTKSLVAYFEAYTVSGEELFVGTDLANSTYIEKLNMGTLGTALCSVSGGKITITLVTGVTGRDWATEPFWVIFNRNYLSGKLLKGHKYRLTINLYSNKEENLLIACIASISSEGSVDSISDDIIYGGSFGTTSKAITLDFTANRNSSTGEALTFAVLPGTTSGVFYTYVTKVSLKEI